MKLKNRDLFTRLTSAVDNKDLTSHSDPEAVAYLRKCYSDVESVDFINNSIPVFLTNFSKKWKDERRIKGRFLSKHANWLDKYIYDDEISDHVESVASGERGRSATTFEQVNCVQNPVLMNFYMLLEVAYSDQEIGHLLLW